MWSQKDTKKGSLSLDRRQCRCYVYKRFMNRPVAENELGSEECRGKPHGRG